MDRIELLIQLQAVADDCLIGVSEVAAITGFAQRTVQQRKLPGFPPSVQGMRRLRWNLGDVRAWVRGKRWNNSSAPINSTRKAFKRRYS